MFSTTIVPALRAHPYVSGLRSLASSGLALADSLCSAMTPAWVRDAPGLLVLAMHSLCRTHCEPHGSAVLPEQNVRVDDLRAMVEATLAAGYTIVSPAEIDAGLGFERKFALLTFDDGYYNNVLALDVLAEFEVPATFFISSGHVLEQRGFWWDALHRELASAGASRSQRNAELDRLKLLAVTDIERHLRARFGADVLTPRDDSDRPFRASELAAFARQKWVTIGNHTVDHAILTRCSPRAMRAQIEDCQRDLEAITGTRPSAIAYPNGNHSEQVVQAARAAGLRLGFTVRPAKNALSQLRSGDRMRLGRFYFHGGGRAERELRTCAGGFVPSRVVRALMDAA